MSDGEVECDVEYSQEEISEERRRIRKKQREIINRVHDSRENITLPDELIKQVNKLDKYLSSDFVATKEAAIDSEGFRLLSAIGREQVEAAHGNLIQFDNITFMEKLVTRMKGRRGHHKGDEVTLDWAELGKKAFTAFKRPPPTTTVFGALELEPVKKRERKQRAPRDKAEASREATKPKEVKDLKDEEESTTKDVQHIMNQVRRVCKERGKIGYFHFLVDPQSFAKTVENMFHFAFLIKDGRVGVELGSDGLPYINLPRERLLETGQSAKDSKNQFITSLTMQDWKRAIEKFHITRSCIPPRTN